MSNPSLYRQLVGSLVYLTVTRPDISYAVHQVSQYLSAPRSTHYATVMRILRYLKGTLFHGLFYSAQSLLVLHAFSDADWVGDPDVHEIYTIKYSHIYVFSLTFMLFCDLLYNIFVLQVTKTLHAKWG